MYTNNRIVSIVDDETDITVLFHDALRRTVYGVSLVSFNDSKFALEHFTANKKNFALVISDWRMPNMNGLELLMKVKKLNPNVRTMLTSAFEVENDPVFQQYMTEGIIDKFLQKPMTLNYLCREVNNQVQAYQLVMNE